MGLLKSYNKMRSRNKTLFENVESIAIGISIAVLAIQFITPARVEGASMEHTLHQDDWLMVERYTYKLRGPSYGDIVAIDTPKHENRIVKRIIALGGDQLKIETNCQVFINGVLLDEPYIKEAMSNPCPYISLTVPEGSIYAMGDNRNASLDSRRLGVFDFKTEVYGRIFWRIYPFDAFTSVE